MLVPGIKCKPYHIKFLLTEDIQNENILSAQEDEIVGVHNLNAALHDRNLATSFAGKVLKKLYTCSVCIWEQCFPYKILEGLNVYSAPFCLKQCFSCNSFLAEIFSMGNKICSHRKCQQQTSQISQAERENKLTKQHFIHKVQNRTVDDLPENLTLMLPYNFVDRCALRPRNCRGLSYDEIIRLSKSENQKSFASEHKSHIFGCFKKKKCEYWDIDSDCSDEWAQEDFLAWKESRLVYQKPRIYKDSTCLSISQEVTLVAESSSTMPLNTHAMSTCNNPHALGTGDAKAVSLPEVNTPNMIRNCKSKFKLSPHDNPAIAEEGQKLEINSADVTEIEEQIQNNDDKAAETKQDITNPMKKVHWKPEIDVIYFGTGSEVIRTITCLKP